MKARRRRGVKKEQQSKMENTRKNLKQFTSAVEPTRHGERRLQLTCTVSSPWYTVSGLPQPSVTSIQEEIEEFVPPR